MNLFWWLISQESTCQCRRCRRLGFHPWVWKIPERENVNPLHWVGESQFLPRESHGQRSLMGYSSQSHKVLEHGLVTKRGHRSTCVCWARISLQLLQTVMPALKKWCSEMLQKACGIHSESRIGEYFSIILSHKKSFSIILFVYFPSSKLVCSFFFSLLLIGFQLATFPVLHDHSEFGTLSPKAGEKSFGFKVLITRLILSHSSY